MRVAADIHIIDDDDGVRSVITAMMQRLGYRVMTFFSADEYLEWMRNDEYSPPNLSIFSDVEMPGMSGYELMNVVRKTNPEQRFIITTGGTPGIAPENTYPCFYFNKPVAIGQLKKAFQVQSMCVKSGPDADCLGCASIGDRHAFGIWDWHCPMTAT